MTLAIYVTFLTPGSFFPDESTQKVGIRAIEGLIIPKGCFALYFWERTEVEQDGELLLGSRKNISGSYYLGGEVFDLARLKKEHPDKKTVISNLMNNDWDAVVLCPTGNWQPFNKGDIVVPRENLKFAA